MRHPPFIEPEALLKVSPHRLVKFLRQTVLHAKERMHAADVVTPGSVRELLGVRWEDAHVVCVGRIGVEADTLRAEAEVSGLEWCSDRDQNVSSVHIWKREGKGALVQEVRPNGSRTRVHPRQVSNCVHLLIPLLADGHAVPQKFIIVNLRDRVSHSERDGTKAEEMLVWNRVTDGVEDWVTSGRDRMELVLCIRWGFTAARLDRNI